MTKFELMNVIKSVIKDNGLETNEDRKARISQAEELLEKLNKLGL